MKLYVFLAAPNPTRVRLYLAEKAAAGARLPVEEVSVNLMEGEQRGEAHLERARVRELERIAEISVLRTVAGLVHATRSPLGLPPSPEMAAFWRGQLPAGLAQSPDNGENGRNGKGGNNCSPW